MVVIVHAVKCCESPLNMSSSRGSQFVTDGYPDATTSKCNQLQLLNKTVMVMPQS